MIVGMLPVLFAASSALFEDCAGAYRGMMSVNAHSIRSTPSRITRIACRLIGYGTGVIASTARRILWLQEMLSELRLKLQS